jgi:hypothetical protein
MNRRLLKLAMVVTVGSLLHSTPAATQVSPTTDKAARVRITQGPAIERADTDFAIIRWTSNNPAGSPEHYGIVHYGTDPTKLNDPRLEAEGFRGCRLEIDRRRRFARPLVR